MSSLKVTWRGGKAYAHGTIAGKRVRTSLGTRQADTAAQLCAALESKLWRSHIYGPEAVVTFAEAAVSYLKNGGEATFIDPVIKHFGARALREITPGNITAAAPVLYPGRSPATWNRQVITPARAIIMHGHQMGWCAPIKVKQFKTAKPKRVAIDRSWIDAFMREAGARELPHLAALYLFMFQTGTRISEALRVTWADVDLHHRTIYLARTKTGEPRTTYLTIEMMVLLANMPHHQTVFRYLSRHGVYEVGKRVCKRAGIAYVPPHQSGRHSAATAALAAGIDIATIMDAFGWKSARLVLETYAHPEGAGQRLAQAMEQGRLAQK